MSDVVTCDDLVIGSGMTGLTVAARLARAGRRVVVLEAHDAPGGYAHTFTLGRYRFCAQVHYVFGCGPGGQIHALLDELGLADEVEFVSLDHDGYDHVVVGGDRYRIPLGWDAFRARMLAQFPDEARGITRYFDEIAAIADELARMPARIGLGDLLTAPFRFSHLLRRRRHTLGQLYDALGLSPRVRAILAGQCGDYLLPPGEVSLLLHASLVTAYGAGAYYPKKHYAHFVDAIVGAIRARPGCAVHLEHEVTAVDVEGSRVTTVTCANGARFQAERVISNIDPRAAVRLVGAARFPSSFVARHARYPYSYGTITLYLGLKGIDLRDHGFGGYNVWSYPHDDLDRIYRVQGKDGDLSAPWLFLSTPTLHTSAPGLAPPGRQILEVATHAPAAFWKELRVRDRRAYNVEKKKLREHLFDVIETRFIPGLRDHVDTFAMGTPATNERFCRAPDGNAYGAALTPAMVSADRKPHRTPIENLWFANATAGWPSIGGTVSTGRRLATELGA